MVEFAAYSGLRNGELAGLEIRDLSFVPVAAGSPAKAGVRVERLKVRKGNA